MTASASRRSFFRAVAGLAASSGAVSPTSLPWALRLAGLGALANQSSSAAEVSGGYKALVCLYMHGGNDSHNWVVPVDAASHAEYTRNRGELALPLSRLQPIAVTSQASGRAFGMPMELAALRKWYERGYAAIVANVGPLQRPITKAEFQAGVDLPPKLFSHNDQASTWQSLAPEGASTGWGGRMGDILMSANAYPVLTAISTSGNAVFLSGTSVTQYQVGSEGPIAVPALSAPALFGSSTAPAALRRSYANASRDPLLNEYNRVMQRGLDTNGVLLAGLGGASVPPIPATPIALHTGTVALNNVSLAKQLRMVAQLIAANQALGMRRQVFMVSIGGFDAHTNQLRDQPALMSQVALSIDYFSSSLLTLGLSNNVTLFTASDFGRTLLSNGDGSDHGWGSHHFVTGGAVRGRDIVGRFPVTALGTADDIGSGRLLPAISVVELAAALGGWMGLNATEAAMVLPGLNRFDNRLALF